MNIALVIQFYWGGKIVKAGKSFVYDLPRWKKIILIKHRIS